MHFCLCLCGNYGERKTTWLFLQVDKKMLSRFLTVPLGFRIHSDLVGENGIISYGGYLFINF